MEERRSSAPRGSTRAAALLVVAVLGAALAGLAGTTAGAGERPAAAGVATPAANGRAVIVIDDGTRRTATCVEFGEREISGLEALRRAGAQVVDQRFGQMGGAVCSINGHGCPLSGCLTCEAPAFWNYFRAVGGGSFVRSGLGASSTKVRDGDVEGWVWGANPASGPLPDFDRVCPARAEPPPPPTSDRAPAAGSAPGGAAPPPVGQPATDGSAPGEAGPGGAAPTTAVPPPSDGTTTTADDGPTTTVDDGDDEVEIVDAEELAAEGAAAARDDEGGGGPWSALAVVVVLVALGAGVLAVRRRRQQEAPAP